MSTRKLRPRHQIYNYTEPDFRYNNRKDGTFRPRSEELLQEELLARSEEAANENDELNGETYNDPRPTSARNRGVNDASRTLSLSTASIDELEEELLRRRAVPVPARAEPTQKLAFMLWAVEQDKDGNRDLSIMTEANNILREEIHVPRKDVDLPWPSWFLEFMDLSHEDRIRSHDNLFENYANEKWKQFRRS